MASAVTTLVIVLLGSPSGAEPKKLQISSAAEGPFRDNLVTPLWQGEGPLVPRDEVDASFFVKNNSGQSARATLAVVNRGRTNAFEQALTFEIDIDGTRATSTVPTTGSPGCTLITTGPTIAPGGVQGIDVSLAVADLAEQVGTARAASLDFVVTLSQVGPRGRTEICGEQAAAQPEVKGEQQTAGGGRDPDCERDVVVTLSGSPTCVPTVVDAGATYADGDPRSPRTALPLAVLLLATGVGMAVLAARRRTA